MCNEFRAYIIKNDGKVNNTPHSPLGHKSSKTTKIYTAGKHRPPA